MGWQTQMIVCGKIEQREDEHDRQASAVLWAREYMIDCWKLGRVESIRIELDIELGVSVMLRQVARVRMRR